MNEPLRVLVVEDSEDDALLLLRELRRGGFEPICQRVETPEALDAAIEDGPWDVVIADYRLPHFSGLAALSQVKEKGLDVPIIVVSGKLGEEAAVEAMKKGANDYITKGNLTRLVPAVERELREAEARRHHKRTEEDLIAERKRVEEALIEKDRAIRRAYVDVLSAVTGGRLIIMTREEIETSLGRACTLIGEIASGKDLGTARGRLREALAGSMSEEKLEEVILAASEAMTNAFKHAGAGRVHFCKSKRASQVAVTDSGPGIDFSILPKATLLSGFSTKPSLGMGFSIMLELCDKVKLATQPGYTSVVLEIGAGGAGNSTFEGWVD